MLSLHCEVGLCSVSSLTVRFWLTEKPQFQTVPPTKGEEKELCEWHTGNWMLQPSSDTQHPVHTTLTRTDCGMTPNYQGWTCQPTVCIDREPTVNILIFTFFPCGLALAPLALGLSKCILVHCPTHCPLLPKTIIFSGQLLFHHKPKASTGLFFKHVWDEKKHG